MNISSILLYGKTFHLKAKMLYIDMRVFFDFNNRNKAKTAQTNQNMPPCDELEDCL